MAAFETQLWGVATKNDSPTRLQIKNACEGLAEILPWSISGKGGESLRVGTLDSLMSLSDDLQKMETLADATVAKFYKQLSELNPNEEPTINGGALQGCQGRCCPARGRRWHPALCSCIELGDSRVSPRHSSGSASLDVLQSAIAVPGPPHTKDAILMELLADALQPGNKVLVFVRTKKACESIGQELRRAGFGQTQTIHADKTQQERDSIMKLFKSSDTFLLVATDVAQRGASRVPKLFSVPIGTG